jgi:hypothetical protein
VADGAGSHLWLSRLLASAVGILLLARWRGSVDGAGHNPAMKLRRLRDGDVLEEGDIVLVRGGDLDPDILSADAARYYSIYGV